MSQSLIRLLDAVAEYDPVAQWIERVPAEDEAERSSRSGVTLRVLVPPLVCGLMLLAVASGAGSAQEVSCAPVPVGEDTGVYFLVLGGNCSAEQAAGYGEVAHLMRDDESSELLVLVDADHADEETQVAATILADQIKAGDVDGATWHDAPPPD